MNELQIIGKKIISLPGRPLFMLDSDVAELYGVEAKVLNQAIKRNQERFPEDFFFQLTIEEVKEVVAKFGHLQTLKFRPTLPYGLTHPACNAAAFIINTAIAIQRSIQIIRVFTAMERFAERRPDATFVDAPDNPFLPSGLQMMQLREMYGNEGAKQILKDYCGIHPGGPRSSITPMEARMIKKTNPNKHQRNEVIAYLLDRGVKKTVLVLTSGLSDKSIYNAAAKGRKRIDA